MTQNPFEVSKEMRELAEKNLEQVQNSFRQFSEALAQGMAMWTKNLPQNEMTASLKAVQDKAVAFAKHNAEAGFALAAELAKAKDVQEVFQLQAKYAQAQMQAFAQHSQELGRAMADGVQKVIKPS